MNQTADQTTVAPFPEYRIPRGQVPTHHGNPHDDDIASWYAWGRMDAGDAPVVSSESYGPSPDSTSTAWAFGAMWADHQASELTVTYGIPTAWEHFVSSRGHTLQPYWCAACSQEFTTAARFDAHRFTYQH